MHGNTGKTYYKEKRKQIKVVSKYGKTYYRYPKTGECKACGTKIESVSTYCQTCYGAERQSKNFDSVMNGEEFDRTMEIL